MLSDAQAFVSVSHSIETVGMESMLKFKSGAVSSMTAALEYVYRKIPPDRDSAFNRKRIADVIMASAEEGKLSLHELRNAGLQVLNHLLYPPRRSWLPKIFGAQRRRSQQRRKTPLLSDQPNGRLILACSAMSCDQERQAWAGGRATPQICDATFSSPMMRASERTSCF
jgi:hypothetical protein